MSDHDGVEIRTLADRATGAGGWRVDGELEEITLRNPAGKAFVIARVPRIARRFASPMHTPDGLTPRLASWRDEFDAFMAGRLPSARLAETTSMESEQAAVRSAVIRAIQEGFAGSLKVNAEGEVYGYLARPDRIEGSVDLDALAADWEDWLTAAGVLDPEIEEAAEFAEEIAWAIDGLREACYSDFLHSLGEERYRGGRVRGAIVDGIAVGDDPATTCAFVLRDLTGDDRLWENPAVSGS